MHPLEKRILLPEDLKPITSLQDYAARGGIKGLKKSREMSSEELIELVKQSGLRGRGGAGFPIAIKWTTVYNDPSNYKYIVCNGAEGEPGTYKDRYTIEKNPYQLLEGMLISAHAVKAHKAIICTKEKYTPIVKRISEAIAEFEQAKLIPEGYIELVLGPNEYLLGEEKAMLEVIDGRDPMPRNFPPFLVGARYTPTENNPTVVNNAETMAHLAHILRNGVEWFKSLGTDDTAGTITLSLCGDVKRPGMYEVETGLTVREALYDLAGGPVGKHPFKAMFSGVANRVMTPDLFDTKIDFGSMRAVGCGLGSGGFIVYDESRCMVAVTRLFLHFLAASSCGQCIPCNMGTRIMAGHLDNLEQGQGSMTDIEAIRLECGRCTNQTRCFLPTQAAVLCTSMLDKFPKEFESHAGNACSFPKEELILPKLESFDEETGQFTYEGKPLLVEQF